MGGQQFNVIKHAVISEQSILKVRLLKTGEENSNIFQNFEVIEKLLRFWLKLILLWLLCQLRTYIDLPENFLGEKYAIYHSIKPPTVGF